MKTIAFFIKCGLAIVVAWLARKLFLVPAARELLKGLHHNNVGALAQCFANILVAPLWFVLVTIWGIWLVDVLFGAVSWTSQGVTARWSPFHGYDSDKTAKQVEQDYRRAVDTPINEAGDEL